MNKYLHLYFCSVSIILNTNEYRILRLRFVREPQSANELKEAVIMRNMNMNAESHNALNAARMWWWQSSLWREFTLKF